MAFAALFQKQHRLARLGQRPSCDPSTHAGPNDNDIPDVVNEIFHGAIVDEYPEGRALPALRFCYEIARFGQKTEAAATFLEGEGAGILGSDTREPEPHTLKQLARDTLLLETLKRRFEANMHRHPGLAWSAVQDRLQDKLPALRSLQAMEASGGEPDVVGYESATGVCTFCDCSAESPAGRRSVCYDREGLESRKEHRPQNSAVDMAASMGIELLTEAQYRALQALGEFDTKTSSWVQTPVDVRKLGGALFCDRRYGLVFTYHNGAQSYYAVRGFRGSLRV